jgi:hypothetical protein
VIAVQGPALASDLAIPAMSRFGDILYDLHRSSVVRLDGDWERQPPAAQRPPATGTLRIGAAASAEYAPRPGAGAE